jgi:hypothetical protein
MSEEIDCRITRTRTRSTKCTPTCSLSTGDKLPAGWRAVVEAIQSTTVEDEKMLWLAPAGR